LGFSITIDLSSSSSWSDSFEESDESFGFDSGFSTRFDRSFFTSNGSLSNFSFDKESSSFVIGDITADVEISDNDELRRRRVRPDLFGRVFIVARGLFILLRTKDLLFWRLRFL
jgi:hypothetical protein